MNNVIDFKNHKEKKEPKDKVNIIGFFQDKYHTDDEFKKPLDKEYLDYLDYPFQIKEQMKDLKNCWEGLDGNIHFSKKWNPDPYVGSDNCVYLMMGDLTMKNTQKTIKLMEKGLDLLKKVSSQEE